MRRRMVAAWLIAVAGCRAPGSGSSPDGPVIESIAPRAGPRSGGTVVRVEGRGFGDAPFATLGSAIVERVTTVSDTVLEFEAPPDRVGPASLTVVTRHGRATVVDAYFYQPLPATAYAGRFFADAADAGSANLVVVTSSETIAGIDLDLPLAGAGSIAGRLSGVDDAPLVGHSVVATSTDGGVSVAFLSTLDGSYRIDGLPPGRYVVKSAEAADSPLFDRAWNGVDSEASATAVDVAAGATTEGIDLVLATGGEIVGEIDADGAPMEGVTVIAIPFAAPNALQFSTDFSDEQGRYRLPGLAPGEYRVLAFTFGTGRVSENYPDAVDAELALPVAVEAGGIAVADLDLDPAAIVTGRATEPSAGGPAIPFAIVRAHEVDVDLGYATSTATDGTYRLEVPEGRYRVEVAEMGLSYDAVAGTAGATILDLDPGEEAQGIDFDGRIGVEPCENPTGTRSLSGTVTGPGGSLVFRAAVVLESESEVFRYEATTGIDGVWSAPCVEPDEYTLFVYPVGSNLAWAKRNDVVIPPSGGLPVLDVAVDRGAVLKGSVRDAATHTPLAGVPVRAENVDTGEGRTTVTGSDGAWSIDRTSWGGLAPGSWRIEAKPHVRSEHQAL